MRPQSVGELRLPAGWLFACLTFWGVATDQALGAIACACLLELRALVPHRWALEPRHYERLADLCSVGFVALAIYLFTEYGVLAIYRVLAAFPWVLLPLAFAQEYGASGRVPSSAFIMSLRKQHARIAREVDLRPSLGCTCLVAASTSAVAAAWYGLAVAGTLLALLAANRSPRYSSAQWSVTVAAALSLAGFTYLGIVRAQIATSDFIQAAIAELGFSPTDPDQAYTAIGTLGRLKLSDRIRLRIATSLDTPLPIRLTEARYQHFENGIWRNRGPGPTTLDPIAHERKWMLRQDVVAARQLTITVERRHDLGALALPAGTVSLAGADLLEIQRHPLGALMAEARPGFLRYQVRYAPSHRAAGAPTAEDLQIPESYQPLLSRVAEEAHTLARSPVEAIAQIEKFFATKFRYSLIQPGYFPGRKPLASFLLRDRAGHCEYFATATTLLLRQSGIPARYVVGYLVDEYSTRERAFIARARHAHAWAEAYIAGEWRVIDTTPGLWLEAEAFHGVPWHLMGDTLNWFRWQLQRVQRGELALGAQGLMALPVLVGWLFWRLRPLARRTRQAVRRAPSDRREHSELRPLFDLLARRGVHPQAGQTTLDFLLRHWPPGSNDALRALVLLHYAERYRPGGLSVEERRSLRNDVTALLAKTNAGSNQAGPI